MRNLEPAGVCSRDLTQCLLKQLERHGERYQVEKVIVTDYLELLGKNQLHVIAKKMKIPIERVQEAQCKIRSLNPKPSSGFSDREVLKYLTPDVTVVKLEEYFEVLVNDYSCPVMQINQEYIRMLKGSCTDETKNYIMDKFRQVEQIQGCIMKRNNTLIRLTKCLIDNQREFFMYGKGHLKPFKMRDAAEILQVHESTISRTVKEKYLQCCWGIFPMGYFFSKSFNNGESSGNIATIELKEQLKKIIDEEDKHKPLSDQKLMESLAEQGLHISRRTVTKYRESMDIADCRGRKQYG
jgi:RNA polymerase sigma-54 factor